MVGASRLHDKHTLLRPLPWGTTPPREAHALGHAEGRGTPIFHPAAASGLGRRDTPGPWDYPFLGLDYLGPFVNVAQFLNPHSPLFVSLLIILSAFSSLDVFLCVLLFFRIAVP